MSRATAWLEAEGIPAFVNNEYYAKLCWGALNSGAQVQVPVDLRNDALHVWKMCSAGEFEKTLDEAVSDKEDQSNEVTAANDSVLLPITFALACLAFIFGFLLLPKVLWMSETTHRHENVTYPFSKVPGFPQR